MNPQVIQALQDTVAFVEVSACLAKKAEQIVATTEKQAADTASLVQNTVHGLVTQGVLTPEREKQAMAKLATHKGALEVIQSLGVKLAEQAKQAQVAEKPAGTAVSEKTAGVAVSDLTPRKFVPVGARTSEKRASDNPFAKLAGIQH